jgi:hypothetical protein
MRAGDDRQLSIVEAKPIGCAALDQRQQLKRLGARSQISDQLGIAQLRDQTPVRTDDGDGAAMFGFQTAAAPDFYHCFSLKWHAFILK